MDLSSAEPSSPATMTMEESINRTKENLKVYMKPVFLMVDPYAPSWPRVYCMIILCILFYMQRFNEVCWWMAIGAAIIVGHGDKLWSCKFLIALDISVR